MWITDEHRALADAVRGWTERHVPREVVRPDGAPEQTPEHTPEQPRRRGYDGSDADADAGGGAPGRPPFWAALAEQGLLGMHVAEEYGGGGYTCLELAVALAETGRALVPGPFLPTVLASVLLSGVSAPVAQKLLPGLADGTTIGAVALGEGDLSARRRGDGLVLDGSVRPVLGATGADVLVLGARVGEGTTWCIVDARDLDVEPLESLDVTRPLAVVSARELLVPAERVLAGLSGEDVRDAAATLFAAEAAGLAEWCLDTAVAYAKTREQFGRPIGTFQAVKHRCAEMLVRVELARAAAWDAARAAGRSGAGRPLAAAVAAAVAVEAAVTCAKDCIQVLGGIGFTWEHDAHLYLRRALSLRQLLGGTARWRRAVASLALAGERRALSADLPSSAEDFRADVRAVLAEVADLPPDRARVRLAELGYVAPHLPRPWGRDAGPVEQIVIETEFRAAGLAPPDLVIGNWVLPTVIRHGSADQQRRFIPPTLRGEIVWCQMFSEPGAGSDLAALSTRAGRVPGGWALTGQKVWTSVAHRAHWAIVLARTDAARPKHTGLTYFLLDMSTPGIDVRPLREITGAALFNEIFLTDVFVPDDCVVGAVNDGWKLARTTLGNERVHMSSGLGTALEGLLAHCRGAALDETARTQLGALVAEGQSLALLGLRTTLRQLEGLAPGPASSVRKLASMGHAQDVTEFGLDLLGPEGAVAQGAGAHWTHAFLAGRALSIAGGTTEIQRNIIAERILGLPREA